MAPTAQLSKSTQQALVRRIGRLRLERQARGLTLDQVSVQTGIDRSVWSRVEQGTVALSDDKAAALAQAYGVTPDDIWSWAGGRPEPKEPAA